METMFAADSRRIATPERIRFFDRDALVLLLQLAALWNLWIWLGTRLVFSGESPWELVPLISLVFFAWSNSSGETTRLNSTSLILAAAGLMLYAVSYAIAPPMIRAIFAMVSLTFVISRWRFGTTFDPRVFTLLL